MKEGMLSQAEKELLERLEEFINDSEFRLVSPTKMKSICESLSKVVREAAEKRGG